MNKTVKIILAFFLTLVIAFFVVFTKKISGSYEVYKLISNLTSTIHEGNDSYNLQFNAGIRSENKFDTLAAFVSYEKDLQFTANVNYNEDIYAIYYNQDSTSVFVSDSDLLISGQSSDNAHFDIAKILGEVLTDYPKTTFIPAMKWSKRMAITAWTFLNCSFEKQEKNNSKYHVINLDEEVQNKDVEFWINTNHEEYIVSANGEEQQISIHIVLTDSVSESKILPLESAKYIPVNANELNTAIYRGALRAGGLLLENMDPPKPDGIDREWGKGLLTYVDDNRVLIAKGTHREIGEAHGALLKDEVRKLVDATLYTINWVYTMEQGSWFIDDLREAYKRESPFIPQKYQEEMEGLAETSGISLEEIQLTNVFPALFHCSGFAIFDSATVDGKLYHGRILDYITDLGLQYYPVIQVFQPEGSYAFANIGFPGFIGSVTGMNEHQVTFGEMGGGGVGDWDGMPMAFLMREGMERAKTLDEAVTIFRETPRTCEYYYVISDGKIPDARGLATTPDVFDVIKPNQFHPQLNEPVKDAVLMSAGSRYKKLVERVKEQYGTIDAEKAIRLMDRPVAMNAALHIVMFAPQTLEFWVANAGSDTPACNEPYTHYSLTELLKRID